MSGGGKRVQAKDVPETPTRADGKSAFIEALKVDFYRWRWRPMMPVVNDPILRGVAPKP